MVGRQVQEHCDVWAQDGDILELEARQLADDQVVGAEPAIERAERAPDVAGHRDRPSRGPDHRAHQLGRRRLAVRPGDADGRLAHQTGAELDLAPDRDPAGACGGDEGGLARYARGFHEELHSV